MRPLSYRRSDQKPLTDWELLVIAALLVKLALLAMFTVISLSAWAHRSVGEESSPEMPGRDVSGSFVEALELPRAARELPSQASALTDRGTRGRRGARRTSVWQRQPQ